MEQEIDRETERWREGDGQRWKVRTTETQQEMDGKKERPRERDGERKRNRESERET